MKLGELKAGRVERPRSLDPGAVRGSYAQRRGLIRDVTTGLTKISTELGKQQAESQANVSNARVRDDGNAYIKAFGDGKGASLKELKGLGIDIERVKQHPDYNPNQAVVPAHVWFSQGLEDVLTKSREAHGETITNPAARNAWNADLEESQAKAIQASYVASAQMQVKYQFDSVNAERELAVEQADWDKVAELNTNPVYADLTSGEREAMKVEVERGRENSVFDSMLVQERYAEVMNMASDDARETTLSVEERAAIYFSANTKQQQHDAEKRRIRGEAQDMNYIDAATRLAEGDLAIDELKKMGATGALKTQQYINLLNTATSDESNRMDAGQQESLEGQLYVRMQLAADGFYPGGVESLAQFKEQMRIEIYGMASNYDEDGNPRAAFDSGRIRRLVADLDKVEEGPYDSREYKEVLRDASLRILNAKEGNDITGLVKDPMASQMYANVREALNGYMLSEAKAGRVADPTKWWRDNRVRYMNPLAKAEFFSLDDSIVKSDNVVWSEDESGRFTFNYEASRDSFAKAIRESQEADQKSGLGVSSQTKLLQKRITELGEWYDTYGKDFAAAEKEQ